MHIKEYQLAVIVKETDSLGNLMKAPCKILIPVLQDILFHSQSHGHIKMLEKSLEQTGCTNLCHDDLLKQKKKWEERYRCVPCKSSSLILSASGITGSVTR